MNEMLLEKLIQKVSNALEEDAQINIKIRALSPPSELLNDINARLNSIDESFAELKKVVSLDEKKVNELQKQMKEMSEKIGSAISQLADSIDALKAEQIKKWGENQQWWSFWNDSRWFTKIAWIVQFALLVVLVCWILFH